VSLLGNQQESRELPNKSFVNLGGATAKGMVILDIKNLIKVPNDAK